MAVVGELITAVVEVLGNRILAAHNTLQGQLASQTEAFDDQVLLVARCGAEFHEFGREDQLGVEERLQGASGEESAGMAVQYLVGPLLRRRHGTPARGQQIEFETESVQELGLGREEELELEQIADSQGLPLRRREQPLVGERTVGRLVVSDGVFVRRDVVGPDVTVGHGEHGDLDDRAVDEVMERPVAVVGRDRVVVRHDGPHRFGTAVEAAHHAVAGEDPESLGQPDPAAQGWVRAG